MLKIPLIKQLSVQRLNEVTAKLPTLGKLNISNNNLVYLKVVDDYIHQVFPLLNDYSVMKPDYFGKDFVGAHITVMYPEENKKIQENALGQDHSFVIKNIVSAEIEFKTYYVLLVESHSLLQLRKKHGLPNLLSFKGYGIDFHITVGVSL